MSGRDNRKLHQARENERVINRAAERVKAQDSGCCGKFGKVCRPFEWLFGVIFFILSLFFAVCLCMTSADKLSQIRAQDPPDYMHGYNNVTNNIINPVDLILTTTQSMFPVDYIILVGIVFYFVLATISGIKSLGVRFCHLKMFNVKAGRTVPQGLLFLIFILLFVILAFNVVLLTLAPQYVTYGSQMYPKLPISDIDSSGHRTCDAVEPYPSNAVRCSADAPSAIYQIKHTDNGQIFHTDVWPLMPPGDAWNACNKTVLKFYATSATGNRCNGAEDQSMANFLNLNASNVDDTGANAWQCRQRNDPCNQTRMSALLHAFFYSAWFLGAIYYWANWLFLVIFFISFVYMTCKKRRSLMQAMMNDVAGDFDDSDDDMAPAKFSWA